MVFGFLGQRTLPVVTKVAIVVAPVSQTKSHELVMTVDLNPIKCVDYAPLCLRIEVYLDPETGHYYPKTSRMEKFVMRRNPGAATIARIEGIAVTDYGFCRPQFIKRSAVEVVEAVVAHLESPR